MFQHRSSFVCIEINHLYLVELYFIDSFLFVSLTQVVRSMGAFLKETGPAQHFLLCEQHPEFPHHPGPQDDSLCDADQSCWLQWALQGTVCFAVSYDEALCNFYTFIQTDHSVWHWCRQCEGESACQGNQSKNFSQRYLRRNTSLTMFTNVHVLHLQGTPHKLFTVV